jgi:hypothetical protein
MKRNNFGSKYISIQTENNNILSAQVDGTFLQQGQPLHRRDFLTRQAETRRPKFSKRQNLEPK